MEGIPLEWRRRCMSYAVDARGARDLDDADVLRIVDVSFEAWLALDCGPGPRFEVRRESRRARCDRAQYVQDGGNVNVIAFVADWTERDHDPQAYALTTVWHHTRTGEIYDVDMEINEERGRYGVCPAPAGCTDGTIDLQNVITHEVGHFFGLAHSADRNAAMYGYSEPGEVDKRVLRGDDVEGFCAIYPSGALPEACDPTPRGGLDLDCTDASPSGCGCRAAGHGTWRLSGSVGLIALAAVIVRRRPRVRC